LKITESVFNKITNMLELYRVKNLEAHWALKMSISGRGILSKRAAGRIRERHGSCVGAALLIANFPLSNIGPAVAVYHAKRVRSEQYCAMAPDKLKDISV